MRKTSFGGKEAHKKEVFTDNRSITKEQEKMADGGKQI